MSLAETLHADMTAAMRSGDNVTRDVLRLVLAAITEAETAGVERIDLDDDAVEAILRKKAKDYSDTAELYRSKGVPERAEAEDGERAVVERYLPAELSDEEVGAIVDEAMTAGGFAEAAQMGQAMKAAMAAIAGRADGKRVSAAVRSRLG